MESTKADVPTPWDEAEGLADAAGRAMRAQLVLLSPPDVDVGTTPSDVVYTENKLRLLHYRPLADARAGTPVLVVYALINKPYILDLQDDRSVVRSLLSRGLDVYLIDWGVPSDADRHLTLGDYVDGYIDRCVDVVRERSGHDKVSVLGYCMGGTLSVLYAALHPDKVRNLLVMAAPIRGDTGEGLLHTWSRRGNFDVDRVVDALGNVPAEFFNLGYNILEPVLNNVGKVARLMDIVDHEDAVRNYLRMERWVGDGIPVAGETLRQFVKDVYQEDRLVGGTMHVGGRRVDLGRIRMPVLSIIGERDHLVPPSSSRPLNDLVGSKDRSMYVFDAGHIGLSVSARAHKELWPKVAGWLEARSDPPQGARGGRPRGRRGAAGGE